MSYSIYFEKKRQKLQYMISVVIVGLIVVGVFGNEYIQCIVVKVVKVVLYLFIFKDLYCIVVNDLYRKSLNFEFDDSKFQLLDIEKVYLVFFFDGEVVCFSKLKLMNMRVWLVVFWKLCKMLYNNVCQYWNKERVVVIVFCKELVWELKIVDKRIMIFVLDEDLLVEMLEGFDEVQRCNYGMYIIEMVCCYVQYEYWVDYKNVVQLKQRIEEWMVLLKV